MKRFIAVLCIVVFGCAVVACSSNDALDTADTAIQPTVPSATGDQCQDPVGDLSSDAKATGLGTDPPGIDLTAGSTVLSDDDKLTANFTTAGPITQTPGTTFVVAQGTPYTPLAFEMRATAKDGGAWDINVITWTNSEQSKSVPVKPTIAGNQLTFTVPMEALPPLGLYQQFGTSAVVDGVDGQRDRRLQQPDDGTNRRLSQTDRIVTEALAPRPTVWANPTRASATCRWPAWPRSCCVSSMT